MTNGNTPNNDEFPDPEFALLLGQIAETPPLPMREEDIASLAHACAAEVRRLEQLDESERPKQHFSESNARKSGVFSLIAAALSSETSEAQSAAAKDTCPLPKPNGMHARIRIVVALAAAVLFGLIAVGMVRHLGRGPANRIAEAPRVGRVDASGLLGSSAKAAAANRISFLLPSVSRDSWVSVLQFRNGEWQLFTKTNRDCQFVEKNSDVVEESIPLEKIVVTRSANHPTYVLFLWTERPSGSFLQKQLDTESIPHFETDNPQAWIAEIARLIGNSSNQLHYYRIEEIAPIPVKKGGGQ